MVTVQYVYNGTIEAHRLSMVEAEELAKALKAKGISCQIAR